MQDWFPRMHAYACMRSSGRDFEIVKGAGRVKTAAGRLGPKRPTGSPAGHVLCYHPNAW
jgi:hypothetical protein